MTGLTLFCSNNFFPLDTFEAADNAIDVQDDLDFAG